LIPFRGWRQVCGRVLFKNSRDNFSVVAAGCAFFALFAVFPALSALISLYAMTASPAHIEKNFEGLAFVLPPEAYDVFITQIARLAEASNQTLGWSLLLSLLVAFWSASAGAQAMLTALNMAYAEVERRSVIQYYSNAFIFTLAGILGGLVVLLAIINAPVLFALAGISSAYESVVGIVRWPLLAVFILVLLAFLYRFGPCRQNAKWRWVSVGSVFATVVWLAASFAFSFYVSHFGHYDKTYGSLGAVIILLFWLYLSFYIVLIGAEINAELELQTAEDTTTGAPKPLGRRGAFVADHVAGGPRNKVVVRETGTKVGT
jgi:membrane protein